MKTKGGRKIDVFQFKTKNPPLICEVLWVICLFDWPLFLKVSVEGELMF